MDSAENVRKVADLMVESEFTVVLTGAGVSTASGLPDYRGPNGLWTQADNANKSLSDPSRYRLVNLWNEQEIRPNAIHYTLQKLSDMELIQGLISQNIDNLHLRSGFPEQKLVELHGNVTLMKCIECDHRYTRKFLGWNVEKFGKGYRKQSFSFDQPVCPNCGGRVISTVVNFGDPMPRKESKLALKFTRKADLFIVLGSSLTVSPAANYPRIAKRNGATLVINNLQATKHDQIADLLISDACEHFVPQVIDYL